MRVINICRDDWANMSYDNCQALRSVGIDAASFKLVPHPYNYAGQSKLTFPNSIHKEAMQADVVQIFHSDDSMLDLVPVHKKTIVYHTGSNYRNFHDRLSRKFNARVAYNVVAEGDLWDLGATNQVFISGAIDTQKITPKFTYPKKVKRIRHHPSKRETNGSDHIFRMIGQLRTQLPDQFEFIGEEIKRVGHEESLNRMADCDIFAETFQLEIKGRPLGHWGITALEAATQGKVVVSNHVTYPLYERHYGPCLIQRANTEQAFLDKMAQLIHSSAKEIRELQEATRAWVEQYHSYEATGRRVVELLF